MKDNSVREVQKEAFLTNFFDNNPYSVQPMIGDAGLRNYYRVTSSRNNFILMDCPPSYTSIAPFVAIANFLNSVKLVAPNIYASDEQNGFILLQDFGDLSAKDFVDELVEHDKKLNFYKLSIDALCHLQDKAPPPSLAEFTNELLLTELDLFLEWYIPHTNGKKLSSNSISQFKKIWQDILRQRPHFQQSIVLRDYHVQNMMILDKNHSIQSLGLLDFQDALLGSPVYDLVSILEDARINVPRNLAIQVLQYYSNKKGLDYDQLMLEYSVLGAQRNLRILGVFARKAVRDNAENYLNFIPSVLKYINYDLSHPTLAELAVWMEQNVRQP